MDKVDLNSFSIETLARLLIAKNSQNGKSVQDYRNISGMPSTTVIMRTNIPAEGEESAVARLHQKPSYAAGIADYIVPWAPFHTDSGDPEGWIAQKQNMANRYLQEAAQEKGAEPFRLRLRGGKHPGWSSENRLTLEFRSSNPAELFTPELLKSHLVAALERRIENEPAFWFTLGLNSAAERDMLAQTPRNGRVIG